jgi:hypothetical protein
MDDETPERWPIARDVALAVGVGLFLAITFRFSGGFVVSWAACAAGAFFLITVHHLVDPVSWPGALVAMTASGAVGGVVWWLVADSTATMWEAAGGGALAIGVLFTLEGIAARLSGQHW